MSFDWHETIVRVPGERKVALACKHFYFLPKFNWINSVLLVLLVYKLIEPYRN